MSPTSLSMIRTCRRTAATSAGLTTEATPLTAAVTAEMVQETVILAAAILEMAAVTSAAVISAEAANSGTTSLNDDRVGLRFADRSPRTVPANAPSHMFAP